MSAQFYNQNKNSYPELQDFDHAMRHLYYTQNPITDQLINKFHSKYAVREYMIRKHNTITNNRPQMNRLAESNLFLEYELKKIKPPSENLYAESNKRQQVYPMTEAVQKILNDEYIYYNNKYI
ncbi:unnamed protein product (macronuclear) [Paramecium tetraurelia]|uniref:Uncharacterized protein n=1 Tax=Paramecium tetraurelia TaxID=5888 RepID=A0DC13_PARTE|nr:uncharacterized protein GSPATT00015457001 [Paramecium tetraurelia]CAK80580.1 unnamed protein product [Paramecium tetraurelia]|eukprot:XP_001447977.1 hypothetical protein (macronuclear) [Paramecium tetraurelia strain d4-2]